MSSKKRKEEEEEVEEEESFEDEEDSEEEKKPTKKQKSEPKVELMSESKFLKAAKPLKIVIEGHEFTAEPKAFSTGSYGWGCSGVVKLKIDGQEVVTQMNLNLPVRGSKKK